MNRGAPPLGLPYTPSRAPLRRLAPIVAATRLPARYVLYTTIHCQIAGNR
jgi:hypothetical protein